MHDTDDLRKSKAVGRGGALGFAAPLVGAALLLAACGGGGGAVPAPQPDPEPAPAAEPEPEPEPDTGPEPAVQADPEPEPVPEPMPAFAAARDVWGAVPTLSSAVRATTRTNRFAAFRGVSHSSEWRSASASVSPAGGGALRIAVGSAASGLSFDSSGGAVFDVEPGLATTGRVVVNRDDDDAGRWSTLGWWMALRGRDFIASAPGSSPTVTAVEIGAFADGPEFRTPPVSLPLVGTATYRGPAHGWYSAEIGSDGNDPGRRLAIGSGNPGSTLAGEFVGTAQFEIRYHAIGPAGRPLRDPLISGYLWPGRFSGVSKDGSTGAVTNLTDETIDGSLLAGGSGTAALFSIDRDTGLFSSEKIEFGNVVEGIVDRRGRWDGRVSSVLNANGHTRSIAGTFGIEGRTEGNTWHAFVGAFVLPLTGCRGC